MVQIVNVTPDKIEALVALLKKARVAYYNTRPILSDAEFDLREDALRQIAPNHAYFTEIGAKPAATSGWQKYSHRVPMTSLNKAQSSEDIQKWADSLGTISYGYCVSEKLDGMSLQAEYLNGTFVRAATRGDGLIGEDISDNVRLMKGFVPKMQDAFTGFIRSEVVICLSDFAAHFPGESNPRNSANGTAKKQGTGTGKVQHLTIISYTVTATDSRKFKTKLDEFLFLKANGFNVPFFGGAASIQEVETIYRNYVLSQRKALDYWIDGLVVEVNELAHSKALGDSNQRPKGGIAYKFPPAMAETPIRDIAWQVGSSGRVTPVAMFDTVDLAGVRVSQASLHNISSIHKIVSTSPAWQKMGQAMYPRTEPLLCEGDIVLISRRNDVIPYVEALITPALSFLGPTTLAVPTTCPCCGTSLIREGEYLVCPNQDECPDQRAGRVARYLDKINVKDWGEAVVEALFQANLIQDLADLYTLDLNTLSNVDMGGRKVGGSATTMLMNLKAALELPLHTLVGSLGIPLWSRDGMKSLVDAGFNTLDKLDALDIATLSDLPGVGLTKAQAFTKGYTRVRPLITKLLANGMKIKSPVVGGRLSGWVVCFTGFRDADLHREIEAQGGVVKGSVVKGLTHLIMANLDSTSAKAMKAKMMGANLLDYSTVVEIVEGRKEP